MFGPLILLITLNNFDHLNSVNTEARGFPPGNPESMQPDEGDTALMLSEADPDVIIEIKPVPSEMNANIFEKLKKLLGTKPSTANLYMITKLPKMLGATLTVNLKIDVWNSFFEGTGSCVGASECSTLYVNAIGFQQAISSTAGVFTAIPVGLITNYVGIKNMITADIALDGTTSWLYALLPKNLYPALISQGFADSFGLSQECIYLQQVTTSDAERTQVQSRLQLCSQIFSLFGAPLGIELAKMTSIQAVFYLQAALITWSFLMTASLLPKVILGDSSKGDESSDVAGAEARPTWMKRVKDVLFSKDTDILRRASVGLFVVNFATLMVSNALVASLRTSETLNLSAEEFGWFLAISQISSILCLLVVQTEKFAGSLSSYNQVDLGLGALAGAFSLVAAAESFGSRELLAGGLALVGPSVLFGIGVTNIIGSNTKPEIRALAGSVMSIPSSISGMVAPLVGSELYKFSMNNNLRSLTFAVPAVAFVVCMVINNFILKKPLKKIEDQKLKKIEDQKLQLKDFEQEIEQLQAWETIFEEGWAEWWCEVCSRRDAFAQTHSAEAARLISDLQH
jgi:hypothetical protein